MRDQTGYGTGSNRKPSSAKRHWKKFLKDQASDEADSPASDDHADSDEQNEAENLCIHDMYKTAESTVAQVPTL
jgi:hypothetical protein